VGLNVGILGAEKCFGAGYGQFFHLIGMDTPRMESPTRLSLDGFFIENRPQGLPHRRRCMAFRRNEIQGGFDPLGFPVDEFGKLRVVMFQMSHHLRHQVPSVGY